MLRINQQKNAAAAKSYYSSPAEYYRPGEQEIVGQWGGKAADRLGLGGDVVREHFERLCDNRHPFTAEQLTARMRKDRRVGYDFTFDAPKSVSILYGLTDQPDILDTFRESVRATMEEMEASVKVRVRKHGQFSERVVGNMAWAEFIHFTARPVKGKTDPHLHGHAFVPNVCWDHVEHAWKAIDVASVKADGEHWQARFQKRFGKRLAELGYDVAWKGDNFEIAGITRDMIDRFSLRTHQINQTAEKRGVTDPKDKDKLGALTRESKRKNETMPGLRAEWRQRLTGEDRAAIGLAALRHRHPAGDRRDGQPAHRQTQPPAIRGSGPAMIARLRARAKTARSELDAWEQERRDWIRQQPTRQEAAATNHPPRHTPGRAR
jgi:conjugative relaxase-like TrwC/TraI family protein